MAERAARQHLPGARRQHRPAAFIFHKIRYAGVFEEGAVIRGQPLLWLPLGNVPVRRGRPMTPSQYVRSVGPLVSVQRAGSPPLLFAKYRAKRSRRRAADSLGRKPLYVGISTATIAKRFDIKGAAEQAAAQLPALYAKHFGLTDGRFDDHATHRA